MGKISEESATQSIDVLIDGLEDLKKRLTENGFDPDEVHSWWFNLREVLEGWRTLHLELAKVFNTDELNQVPVLLNEFTFLMNYATGKDIRMHMEELEVMMDKRFPENLDD